MTVAQDVISSSPQNPVTSVVRTGYDRGRLKRIIYVNMLLFILGLFFMIWPSPFPYFVAFFIAVIFTLLLVTPYTTRKNRYMHCIIYSAIFVLWITAIPLTIGHSAPFHFLNDNFLPTWATRILWGFIILDSFLKLLWAGPRHRLPATHSFLVLNNQGLLLDKRTAPIPWDRIASAVVIYNPALPMVQLGIRIKAPGIAGASFLAPWSWPIPRRGIIDIPFAMLDDSSAFFNALSARLGDRLRD